MYRRCWNTSDRKTATPLTGFEPLESRRLFDCHGLASVAICIPGDSDRSGEFDQADLVHALRASKYLTGEPAAWQDGDWNGDKVFNQLDVVAAIRSGAYLQGKLMSDLSALVASVPAHAGPFGPPIVIANEEQLRGAIADESVRAAIARVTDFSRDQLLLFTWTGSGQDSLIGTAGVSDGRTDVTFRFHFGLTKDLRPHQGLFAVPKDAHWQIDVQDGAFAKADTATYRFVAGQSRLVVSGGFAGVHDEYRIEGPLTLTRSEDGTASLSQVAATLSGNGLSGLDGQQLNAVLYLTRLSGLQTGESTMAFTGRDNSGAVLRLYVTVENQVLTARGASDPPCCDFFQYQMDAMAAAPALGTARQ